MLANSKLCVVCSALLNFCNKTSGSLTEDLAGVGENRAREAAERTAAE